MEPELPEKYQKYLEAFSFGIFFLFFVGIFFSSYLITSFVSPRLHSFLEKRKITSFVSERDKKELHQQNIIRASLTQDSPKPVQQLFLDSVTQGVVDKYAKSAAYFIMHRYFDNKGNVYELYEYAHSDPKLAFLNDAEKIYPDIFKKIEEKKLPTSFSEEGTYAYLAYLEVLDSKGYTDIATQGTAANQYAKMAYIGKMQSKDTNVKNLSVDQKRNLDKALSFAKNASHEVDAIVKSGVIPNTTYVADVVIGLNQYAYALRYFKYFDLPFEASTTPEKVFEFTTAYTARQVPLLVYFTHLINASSLVLVGGTEEEVAKIMEPFIKYDLSKTPREYSVVDRVIKARLGKEKEGVYSRENIVAIAKKSQKFKEWLFKAGWTESDFR